METTLAILLRRIRLTETSLIVTWLTEQHGKLKTMAKGARQPKSRFAGRLDLFYLCEIDFARSRRGDLHTLREVTFCHAHEGLRADPERVALAAYFVELIDLVTEADHPVPEVFDLLSRGLRYVNAHPPSRRALEHFERELTRLLGIADPASSPSLALARVYHYFPAGRAAMLARWRQAAERDGDRGA